MADPEENKEELEIFVQSLNMSEERQATEIKNPTPLELMCELPLRKLAKKFYTFNLFDVSGKTGRDHYELTQYIFKAVGFYLSRRKSIFTNLGEDTMDKTKLHDFNEHYFYRIIAQEVDAKK